MDFMYHLGTLVIWKYLRDNPDLCEIIIQLLMNSLYSFLLLKFVFPDLYEILVLYDVDKGLVDEGYHEKGKVILLNLKALWFCV